VNRDIRHINSLNVEVIKGKKNHFGPSKNLKEHACSLYSQN
jgi:hypothetical protein